jgi:UDP-glucose 4-epimerase
MTMQNEKKITKALVTGGAGFIGSHIVDELISRGIETVVIDDFSTGSRDNLAQNKDSPLLRVIEGDVFQVRALLEGIEGIDVVFHEAAIASVPRSVHEPLLVHRVNVDASLHLMNYCVEKKIRRFIFASSAAVYGVITSPATEEMRCAPSSPYGSSKLAVETYLSSFYNTYGLETVGLRYFNVFGPRQMVSDYSGVITVFINNLLGGTVPTIFGDGTQTRDFVFVKDIVQANVLAMEKPSANGDVFNVASGSSTTLLNLLDVLQDVTNVRVHPKFMPQRVGDVKSGEATITKIERTMGYHPQTSLRDGLAQVVDAMRSNSNNNDEKKRNRERDVASVVYNVPR